MLFIKFESVLVNITSTTLSLSHSPLLLGVCYARVGMLLVCWYFLHFFFLVLRLVNLNRPVVKYAVCFFCLLKLLLNPFNSYCIFQLQNIYLVLFTISYLFIVTTYLVRSYTSHPSLYLCRWGFL